MKYFKEVTRDHKKKLKIREHYAPLHSCDMYMVDGEFFVFNQSKVKSYKLINNDFWTLCDKILDLGDELFIKEGFYDKSLNTEIFGQFKNFEINIDDVVTLRIDPVDRLKFAAEKSLKELIEWKNKIL